MDVRYNLRAGSRFSELVGKVKEVYDKKRPDEAFGVAWNEFANTQAGMDAVILFNFDKWAFMDRQNSFGKDFEEVHGEGSWHNFLNQFSEVTDGRIDWMRTRID